MVKIKAAKNKQGAITGENLSVLTLEQEVLIVQKILETRDLSKSAQDLSVDYKIVAQVATKYSDVIGLLVQNTFLNEVIQQSYEETLKTALKANKTIIELLSRQVQILWDEYNKKENQQVLMKDYLITQILQIQDRLQKVIDKNDVQYKMNKEFLLKQLSITSTTLDENDKGDYSDNVEAVFNKLKAKDDAILAVNRANCLSPKNAYSFDMGTKLEDGSFTEFKHYTSCKHCADENPELDAKSIQKACRRQYMENNTKEFLYKKKYVIKNLKQGFETKI